MQARRNLDRQFDWFDVGNVGEFEPGHRTCSMIISRVTSTRTG
jgi:hypothetical protein